MRKFLCLLLLAFAALSISRANAYIPFPSLSGASGLTRIPDAFVIPYKNWNIAFEYGTQYNGTTQQPAFNYKANIGAIHNFELGLVGGLDSTGTQLRDGVYVNMKYSPNIGDGSDPLYLAIGTENLASKTQTDLYMVATKPFKQGPILSFGFMADFPNGRFRPLGMAGVDMPFSPLNILVDLLAGETLFQLNGGIRYKITRDFVLEGRAINALGSTDTTTQAKDPKQYLIGFAWLNPF